MVYVAFPPSAADPVLYEVLFRDTVAVPASSDSNTISNSLTLV